MSGDLEDAVEPARHTCVFGSAVLGSRPQVK